MSEVRVTIGQQWRSMDRRDSGSNERIVEVTSVSDDHVMVKNVKTGHVTRVLKRRMRPNRTGFELVKDVEDAAPKSEPEAAA